MKKHRLTQSVILGKIPLMDLWNPSFFKKIIGLAIISLGAHLSWSADPIQLDSSAQLADSAWKTLPVAVVEGIRRADPIEDLQNPVTGERNHRPNCHWLALAWNSNEWLAHPEFVNFDRAMSILARDYVQVSAQESRAGDLVVFWYFGKERYKDDQGRPQSSDAIPIPYHSTVLLKKSASGPAQDLLFQKMNAQDKSYLWATFEQSFDRQNSLAHAHSNLYRSFTKLESRYYRLR